MRIDIVAFDGLDELDALGPLEVFRRAAAAAGAGVVVRLVTRQVQDVVRGAYGIVIVPDAVYQPGADILLVPGEGWVSRSPMGAWGEVQRGDWLPVLTEARRTTANGRVEPANPARPGRSGAGQTPRTRWRRRS